VIFLRFLLNIDFFFFYETFPRVDQNIMHIARIKLGFFFLFKTRGFVLSFDVLHVQIFMIKYTRGYEHFVHGGERVNED